MILVDANLLVYAHVDGYAQQHEPARTWLNAQLAGTARVGFAWSSALAFVRLITNPRLFPEPASMSDAWDQVGRWLDAPPTWTPLPTVKHREVLGSCLTVSGLVAKDVPDAHLAALAIEHGLQLATTDSGFARFPRLRWFNPLTDTQSR